MLGLNGSEDFDAIFSFLLLFFAGGFFAGMRANKTLDALSR
jgi:hypothetical protein